MGERLKRRSAALKGIAILMMDSIIATAQRRSLQDMRSFLHRLQQRNLFIWPFI